MRRPVEEALKVSLTEVIEGWLETAAEEIGGLPIVGDDVAEIMATGALVVLRGIANTEDYLKREKMLTE